jgi:hypothetical protein
VCGGVQKKTTPNSTIGTHESSSVTAVQPIRAGKQPAMPPQTMFWVVRRLSTIV